MLSNDRIGCGTGAEQFGDVKWWLFVGIGSAKASKYEGGSSLGTIDNRWGFDAGWSE